MKSVSVVTTIDFPTASGSYNVIRYPAGETQVRIVPEFINALSGSDNVIVNARVRSAQDLVELSLLGDAISTVCPNALRELRIPYLPYARADRRFAGGDCYGLGFLSHTLSYGQFDAVTTLDVHSAVAGESIDGLHNISPRPFILKAMKDVEDKSGRGTILLPDEGAVGRYDNLPWPTLNATKKRDPLTGKLSGFEVPPISKFGEGPILIVDDICDGGGTFLGIAKELGNSRPLYLYTTHGIFSKGFVDLRAMFKRIYTTDSVRTDLQSEFLTVYDAFSLFQ